MEMEKIMGCQIPAFGMWNYCHDLSITQYFDSAMQARLMRRWSHRDGAGEKKGGAGGEQLALFRSYSFQRKPTQVKVIRREVGKHCNGGELPQDGGGAQAEDGACFSSRKEDGACTVKRKVAVDEDLYKMPQPLQYHRPKKMRNVVWSMWIGCFGLDCIA